MFNKFPIDFYFDGRYYQAQIKPLIPVSKDRIPNAFQVFLNHLYYGELRRRGSRWESDSPKCAMMAENIGNSIREWYEC